MRFCKEMLFASGILIFQIRVAEVRADGRLRNVGKRLQLMAEILQP